MSDISYLSVMICFIMFFVNDIYGFISWRNMHKRQLNRSAYEEPRGRLTVQISYENSGVTPCSSCYY